MIIRILQLISRWDSKYPVRVRARIVRVRVKFRPPMLYDGILTSYKSDTVSSRETEREYVAQRVRRVFTSPRIAGKFRDSFVYRLGNLSVFFPSIRHSRLFATPRD